MHKIITASRDICYYEHAGISLSIIGQRVSGPEEISEDEMGKVFDTKMDEGQILSVRTAAYSLSLFTDIRCA